MRYVEAGELRARVRCKEAIAVALRATSDREPPPDVDSIVQCKEKVRTSQTSDNCYIVDGSNCPKGKES